MRGLSLWESTWSVSELNSGPMWARAGIECLPRPSRAQDRVARSFVATTVCRLSRNTAHPGRGNLDGRRTLALAYRAGQSWPMEPIK